MGEWVASELKGHPVADRVTVDGVTYQYEWIRCGKPTCHCAVRGDPGHGPYWYGYKTNKRGEVVKRYVGKELETGSSSGRRRRR